MKCCSSSRASTSKGLSAVLHLAQVNDEVVLLLQIKIEVLLLLQVKKEGLLHPDIP